MAVYLGKAVGGISVYFFNIVYFPCFQHGSLFRGGSFPRTLICLHGSPGESNPCFRPSGKSVCQLLFGCTFFLSSLCALFGIHCTGEHVAASACGILWLLLLLARSLPAIPGEAYIYPFIRNNGEQNSVWLWNKGIVSALGLSLWGILYLMCMRTGTKKS